MHSNFFRVGGLACELPSGLCDDIYKFCFDFSSRIDELEELLTDNKI